MASNDQIIVPIKNQQSEQIVTNKNFLSPIGYRFNIQKLPYTNFFVQRANLPGITLGHIDVPTPFIAAPTAGDHLLFNEFSISFRVDEDLKNWIEIYQWIRGSSVISLEEYAHLFKQAKTSGHGLKSDFTLTIETSKKNPNYNINFTDGFPVTITDLNFDIMDESVNYIESTTTFKYLQYTIERVV